MNNSMHLHFSGPFPLVNDHDILEGTAFKNAFGIYLWTVKIDGDYYITYIGETCTSFYKRTKEHLIQTLGGNYRIWDGDALRKGIETIVWDGLWRKDTRDKLPEFVKRYEELAPIIKGYIKSQELFVAPLKCESGTLRRIEGEIAFCLRADKTHSRFLPDDIRFSKRNSHEDPISVAITSTLPIVGLPKTVTA